MIGGVPVNVIKDEYQGLSVVLFLTLADGAPARLIFQDVSPHPVTLIGAIVALACF